MIRIRSVATGVPGAPWYTNLYFNGDTGTEATAAANKVKAFWDALGSIMGNVIVTQVQSDAPVIDPATGQATGVFSVTVGPSAGASSAPLVAAQDQGLIRLRTGTVVNGRRVQGRIFVPGIIRTNLTNNGDPGTNNVTVMNQAGAALLTGTGPGLVVFAKTSGQVAPVGNVSAWDRFAVLRSRRD